MEVINERTQKIKYAKALGLIGGNFQFLAARLDALETRMSMIVENLELLVNSKKIEVVETAEVIDEVVVLKSVLAELEEKFSEMEKEEEEEEEEEEEKPCPINPENDGRVGAEIELGHVPKEFVDARCSECERKAVAEYKRLKLEIKAEAKLEKNGEKDAEKQILTESIISVRDRIAALNLVVPSAIKLVQK